MDEPEARYRHVSPPLRQQRLGNVRRTIRPRLSMPPKAKKQNSLTQMQWVLRSDASIKDSEDEEQDGEYSEPRPQKRRRKGKFDEKTESQATYTQVVRTSSAKRKKPNIELYGDGFQIWEDENVLDDRNAQERAHEMKPPERAQQKQPNGRRGFDRRTADASEDQTPMTETEAVSASTRSRSHARIPSCPKAATAIPPKIATPTTKKRFPATIPPSQSPMEAPISTQRSQRYRDAERSPLKERSANVRSPTKRVLNRKSYSVTTPIGSHQVRHDAESSEPHRSSVGQRERQQPRTMRRTATIQDSQVEDDLEFEVSPLKASAAFGDDLRFTAHEQSASTGAARNETDRVEVDEDRNGVNEAGPAVEADDSIGNAEESPASVEIDVSSGHAGGDGDCEYERLCEDDDLEDEDYNDDAMPETFDPVHSALDRDAARFGQTQTQHNPLLQHVSNSTASNDIEEGSLDNKDASAGQPDEFKAEGDVDVQTMAVREQLERELGTVAIENVVPSSQPAERAVDLVIPESPEARHRIQASGRELIPSSPPALRPSQVSTVAPTQMSPARPIKYEPLTFDTFAVDDLPASPTRKVWQDTASSSPFPLPPWSSLERQRTFILGGGEDLGASLLDFSLPPPPPLSSSSRIGTQIVDEDEEDVEL